MQCTHKSIKMCYSQRSIVVFENFSASKIQPQQIRQLQMQKRPAATVQIQNPQKMTGLKTITLLSLFVLITFQDYEYL